MVYDKEYNGLMKSLGRKDGSGEKSVFFKGLDGFTDNELYELRLRCSRETEKIESLTKEEVRRLSQFGKGKNPGFQITTWNLKGVPDTKKIMGNLKQLADQMPELRTNYIYQGISHPVRVVYRSIGSILKFVDFRNVEEEQRGVLLWNIMAAETRRRYDAQVDPPVKITGFLSGKQNMTVMLSMCSFVSLPMESKDLLSRIFAGMEVWYGDYGMISAARVEKMNREMVNGCIEYWKEEIMPVGDVLELPGKRRKNAEGEQSGSLSGSIYKTLDEKFSERLRAHCREQGYTQEALFLMVWGEFFGRHRGIQEPVLVVGGAGECMNLFPIKVRRKIAERERIQDIDRQLAACESYSACTFDELCNALGIGEDQFKVVQHYIEFGEGMEISDIASKTSGMNAGLGESGRAELTFNCYCFGKEISLNYLYSRANFYDVTIEKLHEIFVRLLEEQISKQKKEFNLREDIELTDNAAEKLEKIRTAQKALYIKQSGLFGGRNVEELMALAEKADLRSYAVSDIVLEEGQSSCYFAFLAEGNIEESRIGVNGIIKSVSMRRAGQVFAVESILDDNVSGFTYTVVSREAKILWVERKDLLDFINGAPEDWRALLEVVFKESCKMKRLWTTM